MTPEGEMRAAGHVIATNLYTVPARCDEDGIGFLTAFALGVLFSAAVVAVIVAAAWSKVGAP